MEDSSPSQRSLRDQFLDARASDPRSDVFRFLREHPERSSLETAEVIKADMQLQRQRGVETPVEYYLHRLDGETVDPQVQIQLIAEEFRLSKNRLAEPSVETYLVRFPELEEESIVAWLNQSEESSGSTLNFEVSSLDTVDYVHEGVASSSDHAAELASFPDSIGRYSPSGVLGSGAFGVVYQAWDNELQRTVALKVPRSTVAAAKRSRLTESIREEARVLASLDHPNIVPIHDIQLLAEGRLVLVSRYVSGSSLQKAMKERRFSYGQAAMIVAIVADALHYAHKRGVYHRDVKPANILLDEKGKPWVVDFGLALKFEDADDNASIAGTPAYMSPEQARGESDMIDGRSDIYSLGVVLYEMLTGQRPFQGDFDEVLARIQKQEARPPRSIDDQIPRDMERICLTALSKSMSDRYTTALDMAEELRSCLTYGPAPLDVSEVDIPPSLQSLMELLAKNNHDVWAEQRIADGWQHGQQRNDQAKTHPDLIPYEQLSEVEKEYDRRTVAHTLKAIIALGYEFTKGQNHG